MPSPFETLAFDPEVIAPRDSYALLCGAVTPRPIALVSTISREGHANLAPFSFFNAGGSDPPSLVFSVTPSRSGTDKDTLRNIKETGEFVVHIVSYAHRDDMTQTAHTLPFGESEWNRTTFTPIRSTKVKPMRAAELPVAMECKVYQIAAHGAGAGSANYIVGEVVLFHVAPDILTNGVIDPQKLDVLGRLGGNGYVRVSGETVFEMERPG